LPAAGHHPALYLFRSGSNRATSTLPELPRAEVLSTPTCNQICASLSCFHCFFPRSPLVSPYLPFPLFLAPTTTDRVDREAARLSSLGSLRGPSPISLPRPSQLLAVLRSVPAAILTWSLRASSDCGSFLFSLCKATTSRAPGSLRHIVKPSACLDAQGLHPACLAKRFPRLDARSSTDLRFKLRHRHRSSIQPAVLLRIRFCLPRPIASFVRHLSACPVLSRALSPPSIAMS
jgi:hypothetical protein